MKINHSLQPEKMKRIRTGTHPKQRVDLQQARCLQQQTRSS
jgi:hypothetical protein